MTEQASAILALYFEKRDALQRLLVARLGSAQDAEDVQQDLYLRVCRLKSGEIHDPASYLFRMALNLARDHSRALRRSMARDSVWADAHGALARENAASDEPNAETTLAAKQRLAAIRAALDELSPQCRRVFVTHKFDGLSHQETADRLGISRSTVEKHMHTALRRLAQYRRN